MKIKPISFVGLTVFVIVFVWMITVFYTNRPRYHGEAAGLWLQNNLSSKANRVSLNELLTLKEIVTGEEPDIATFEAPINYDALTNIGDLILLLDNRAAQFQECDRSTNGYCLLRWNTTYDPPGKHYIQAEIRVSKGLSIHDAFKVTGPIAYFYSTNVCQFNPVYTEYDTNKGGWLQAKLIETTATYSIVLRSKDGHFNKTITGSTTNGTIITHWDLADNSGNIYTNGSEIETTYYITFPDSGTHIQKSR
jgi:hypothetical protein